MVGQCHRNRSNWAKCGWLESPPVVRIGAFLFLSSKNWEAEFFWFSFALVVRVSPAPQPRSDLDERTTWPSETLYYLFTPDTVLTSRETISNIMGDSTNRSLSGTGNTKCRDIENSYDTWNNYTITLPSDRKREILEWLSPLEPQGGQQDKRHQDVLHNRIGGIGDWLLETDEFLKWRDCEDGSVNRAFFCSGGPGVGKTYLK